MENVCLNFLAGMYQKTFNECQKQPPEVLFKKGVLKSLANFTEKHLC